MKDIIFVSTNSQKILSYLVCHSDQEFLAGEIEKKLHLSKGGVNQSLRKLSLRGLIKREKKGSIFIYAANNVNNAVKQFKVMITVDTLNFLIEKIKKYSKKIILFGSSARGEDISGSDIDLFILSNNPNCIMSILNKIKFPKKIQPIIRTPLDFTEMETTEPVFHGEIIRGITLWESKE